MTIEEKLSKIKEIVTSIEEENLTLEESLSRYEQGIRLVREVNSQIDQVEKQIKILEADNERVSEGTEETQ